ncbi:MAG: 4-(cytidine 5'-diphospho)-2-C-methyl-D-erythritol kinase [Clostridiales bacterium]|nr:4-(cytidine 5'-diphospho)-2-C-methyl-D-erythritol kinase [Clostridiales bacterium]
MEIKAYAKVNLLLNVLGKRPDGYHELCTLMHTIDLYDTVTFEPANDIRVLADVPLPEKSAAYKAIEAYKTAASCGGAHVSIKTGIPSEAGLGSSSADAAAVLRAMQKHYGALSGEALFAIAAKIGADVPFCLLGGAALCEGIGEKMTPLPPMPLALLIVKGVKGVSTKALFTSLQLPLPIGDACAAVSALRSGSADALVPHVYNALSAPAAAIAPETEEYKARLLQAGALAAEMTGSGSAVFGIFPSEEAAKHAAARFPDAAFVKPVKTLCI